MATVTVEPINESVESETLADSGAFTERAMYASLETDRAFDVLRTSGEAIADLVDDVFDDFELLGSELALHNQLTARLNAELAERTDTMRALERAEAELRTKLAAAERELSSTQSQLTDLPQQVQQLREQLHGIELERCSLEVELEAIRVRAAELTDQLVELKRESTEERTEWSGELKQLRRSLERQTELFADRLSAQQRLYHDTHDTHDTHRVPSDAGNTAMPAAADSETPPAVAIPAQTNDAVLGSVISQFQALQRDRQRRRAK